MIVNCEKCKTGFNLDEELIGESGSKVRCSKCHHIFTAYRAPLAGETGPGAEEELGADQRTDLAQAPSSLAEDGESEAQPPEGPEEDTEEALEFGLFESEEKAGEEISLADLGLEEEPGAEAPAAPTEQEVEPDEITAEDLGFGEEDAAEEPAPAAEEPASEEELGEELSLEDLSLDEEVVSEEAPSLAEEEISLEDLGLEEEPGAEAPAAPTEQEVEPDEITAEDLGFGEEVVSEEPAPAAEEAASEEKLGEELSLEDLSLDEEVVSEEAPSLAEEGGEKEVKAEEEISLEEFDFEESTADEEAPEIAEDIVVEPSEDVAVASIEEEGQEAEAEEPEEEAALPPILEKEPRPRRSIGAPFLALLIIGLVGAGAYTAYTILGTREIKIPFLESLTGAKKSDKVDPGNMRIAFVEQFISGKFVDNNKTGRIFVIKGKIRNDYSEARNFIRVRGALYLKDGKEAQSRIVYCGNALSDTDLKMLDVPTINKRLGNRFGDSKSNFKIPSGKILPFTVVFSNLPRDLGEFSVEVVGSVPA